TGTLITVAGFLPVGLAPSSAGGYTVSIFQVVAISVLVSLGGGVMFLAFLGYKLLKAHGAPHGSFGTPFYRRLRWAVDWSVEHRKTVIGVTLALFVAGGFAFVKVPKQFFPQSNRAELLVDLWLPEGSSFARSEAAAKSVEAILAKDEDVAHYATYVGAGTPRFFLLITQQLANVNLVEIVAQTKDNVARE